jgi:hypothetical protein
LLNAALVDGGLPLLATELPMRADFQNGVMLNNPQRT